MSSVTEGIMSLGSFEVRLKPTTPMRIRDLFTKRLSSTELAGFFTHIIVTRGRVSVDAVGPASFLFPNIDVFPSTESFPLQTGIYDVAAYAGVVQRLPTGEDFAIGGVGMEMWLGDQGRGNIYESTKTLTKANLHTVIDELRPAAVSLGEISDVGATFTGSFKFVSPREAIRSACDAMGVEYRVNPDATIDAGPATQLYGGQGLNYPSLSSYPSTTLFPLSEAVAAVLVRRAAIDPEWKTLAAKRIAVEADIEGYATRVLILSGDSSDPTLAGSADLEIGTKYRDIRGNLLKRTMVADETAEGNIPEQARSILRRNVERNTLSLAVSDYDVEGKIGPGFWVNVYDSETGLIDLGNEITFHGRPIWPVKIRVVGVTWPITRDMGVYHRAHDGSVTDISDWVEWGDGDTEFEIGALSRSLFDIGSSGNGDGTGGRVPSGFTVHKHIVGEIPAFTKGALPTPTSTSRLAYVTDSVRGVWMDQGSQYFALGGEVVNVKEFGAIADGASHPLLERFSTVAAAQVFYPFVTSLSQEIDWAASQAAMDAAAVAGRCVEWPATKDFYQISDVLETFPAVADSVVLRGKGGQCSRLRLTGSTDLLRIGDGVTRLANVHVEDLGFLNDNNDGAGWALKINGCPKTYITCYADWSSSGSGVILLTNDSHSSRITHTTLSGVKGVGVKVESNACSIAHSLIEGQLNTLGTLVSLQARGGSLHAVTLQTAQIGVDLLPGGGYELAAGYFENFGVADIRAVADSSIGGLKIHGNQFQSGGTAPVSVDLSPTGAASITGVDVSGNQHLNAYSTGPYRVNTGVSGTIGPDDINAGNTALVVGSRGDELTVFDGEGNVGSGTRLGGRVSQAPVPTLAVGDTTPSVKAANVFRSANTAATTITALDDGVAGQRVTILFGDANTTLSDAAPLFLAGAFTATDGDTLELITPNGTDWHEISRSVN